MDIRAVTQNPKSIDSRPAFRILGIAFLPLYRGAGCDQPNLQGANIILKVPPPLGARNGNDVISLGQQPGERKLRRRATLPRGKRLHLLDEIEIPLEVAQDLWRF